MSTTEARCRFPLRCPCADCRRVFASATPDDFERVYNARWQELRAANAATLAFLEPAEADPDGDW